MKLVQMIYYIKKQEHNSNDSLFNNYQNLTLNKNSKREEIISDLFIMARE